MYPLQSSKPQYPSTYSGDIRCFSTTPSGWLSQVDTYLKLFDFCTWTLDIQVNDLLLIRGIVADINTLADLIALEAQK